MAEKKYSKLNRPGMLRIALLMILLIHGLIHLPGFAKVFAIGNTSHLTVPVSKTAGLLWLAASLLFITCAVMFLLHKQGWYIIAIPAVILSQVLIILIWQDAKACTIANVLILIAAILSFTNQRFENTYRQDVKDQLLQNNAITNELLTEQDLAHLPPPVQKYLRYAGVLNKPKVKNVRIVMEGRMREKGKDWFSFTSEQYNFFDEPARLFFIKGNMFGTTVPGYHHYINTRAVMDIRLFGLFPLVRKYGPVMDKTETVTLFNDMCLMIPATLVDKRIQWQLHTDTSVTAAFTNHHITVTAHLVFNTNGQLINFISADRTSVKEMKDFRFSTPVTSYGNINNYNIISAGEAVWHYNDGPFVYGKFNVKTVAYNITEVTG